MEAEVLDQPWGLPVGTLAPGSFPERLLGAPDSQGADSGGSRFRSKWRRLYFKQEPGCVGGGRDPAFVSALTPTTVGCWVGHCISGLHFSSESRALAQGSLGSLSLMFWNGPAPWRGQEGRVGSQLSSPAQAGGVERQAQASWARGGLEPPRAHVRWRAVSWEVRWWGMRPHGAFFSPLPPTWRQATG